MPKKILIIDDADMYGDTISNLLIGFGHSVQAFMEGDSALEWWKDSDQVDLILLDLNNDKGMGGVEFMKEITERGFFPEVYLMTGADTDETDNLLKKYDNITKMLLKPFSVKNDLIIPLSQDDCGDGKMAA